MPTQRTSPLARTIDLGDARSASDARLGALLDPLYTAALERAPYGVLVARGLPFQLADAGADRRWLVVDGPVRVELDGVTASHLVLLQFCDAWRDDAGERPVGVPLGWVMPVGEPLASIAIETSGGDRVETTLRRRFEVNEGIIGWGSGAFLCVPHRAETAVDWRGPHPTLAPGRYAPAGHTGPMTVLPSGWGTGQTGVEDFIPSGTDDLMLWIHAIDVSDHGTPRMLRSIELAPIDGPGAGRLVVVAAMTAFSGRGSPLRWRPRRSIRLTGAQSSEVGLDLGTVARRRPMSRLPSTGSMSGWGVERIVPTGAEEVELTAADDAFLYLGDQAVPLAAVGAADHAAIMGGVRIEALPEVDRRLAVELVDADGRRVPARVRFTAHDGRYLPPLGHRHEVNFGLNEDLGADVLLGGAEYAYVDGSFEVDIPAPGAKVEVVRGFDLAPVRAEVGVDVAGSGPLRLAFGAPVRPSAGRWVAGDTHVHFLAPSTALLQARAEGVNVVHLLATAWGDHHTNVTDFGGDIVDSSGEHAVWVGSENRQNILGHIGLVGTHHPILPYASGGPPEGPIGGPVTHLMADWLERCRSAGGLAIGAHFPLPTAEVASDIAMGLLDALELETFDPTLESPPIREWYRYLDAGYRLPLVGGTDKMTAEVPLGQIRTWARLEDDASLTFESWAAAVRAGRTFVTSGPVLELRVEGRGPGDVLDVDPDATLEVELVARAAQPVISAVEIVMDGSVVATRSSPTPQAELVLTERIRASRTGWVAGRSHSPFTIGSAFATSMAAHTSPIYLEVRDRPRIGGDMTVPLALVDGTRAWLEALAPLRDARDLDRFVRFLDESARRLRERGRVN